MSIFDVVEIAEWKRDNMNCIYCEYYRKIGCPCQKGITVQNLSESFNCPHYNYNGELNEK